MQKLMTLWTLKSIKCGGEKTGEQLDQVGALWKENSQQVHPLFD